MPEAPDKCLNCETLLMGEYCYQCGQRKVTEKDKTLLNFFKQFLGAAFFLENSFLKNIWKLVSKPGLLTLDFIEGRRKRWMAPFSLFLLINLIFFISNPLKDFNLPLQDHISYHATTYSRLAVNLVESRMAERGITYEEYATVFNQETTSISKLLIIIIVPIQAFIFYLLFFRKRFLYADHFVYAIHFWTFSLLAGVVWPLFLDLILLLPFNLPILILQSGFMVLIFWYSFASIKRVFNIRNLVLRLFLSGVMVLLTLVVMLIYRFLIFMITFSLT